MTPRLSILVIVYNKDWEASPTLVALDALSVGAKGQIELIVHDNSPHSRLHASAAAERGFASLRLVHDGQNHPLGHVYRRFVRQSNGRQLLLLDDDTALTEAYLGEIDSALAPADGARRVCVPQIFDSHGRLYSPSEFGVFSGRLLASIEPGLHSGLNAVMSGLALNRSYALELGPAAFCVRTPLYGVDTMFMLAHGRAGGRTWVSRSTFGHSFSHDQRRSMKESVARSWLEAKGLFWTVVGFRTVWVPVLPLYLVYFMAVRVTRAALLRL